MKRISIILFVVVISLAFGQNLKLEQGRLSPRLLNYQGFMTDTLGNPINDSFDILFRIYDASSAGNLLWSETQMELPIIKGIFHVLLGNAAAIPDSVFTKGTDRWLELRFNSQTLSPRTRIVSAPYAYTATYSDTSAYARLLQGKDTTALDGRYVNEGQVNSIFTQMVNDTAVTMVKIARAGASTNQVIKWTGTAWQPGTDASGADNDWTYLVSDGADTTLQMGGSWGLARPGNVLFGNADSTHVNFGVACTTGTSGQNNKYCVVVGGFNNNASNIGASVGGGMYNTNIGDYAVLGGGGYNLASGNNTTLCGGWNNTTSGPSATVVGGLNNIASGNAAFVGGGSSNVASGGYATVVGGTADTASGGYATVVGGYHNVASGSHSSVGGGYTNTVKAAYGGIFTGYRNLAGDAWDDTASVIASGFYNRVTGKFGFIGGGKNDSANGDFAAVAGGYSNLAGDAVDDTAAVVGGGYDNSSLGRYSSVLGGRNNKASGYCSIAASGVGNNADSAYSTVSGGANNTAGKIYATVGGGIANWVGGERATVSGGSGNWANGQYSFVGGGQTNRAYGDNGTVAGGYFNTVRAYGGGVLSGYNNLAGDSTVDNYAIVAGGYDNQALERMSFVGGGMYDTSGGISSVVCGGAQNSAFLDYATVGGGYLNKANGLGTTISGGQVNNASGSNTTVAGGQNNNATISYATIGGGLSNTASSMYATVSGGYTCVSSGAFSNVSGGYLNVAYGYCASVAGGIYDSSLADYSFSCGQYSKVPLGNSNSAAFNGQAATAPGQTRVGILSKASGTFTIDHPLDPEHKILNHYFVESPDMSNVYSGSVILDASGKAKVNLPDYFDALNRDPRVQLTGVGSPDVVYVAEDFKGNTFAIGGKPGMKVYWTVIADRKDQSAEITRDLMPVEQVKEGGLAGRSLDDDLLLATKGQLERMGKAGAFKFRHASEEKRYEEMKKMIEEGK